MKECTVNNCDNLRDEGDSLFCFRCRDEWKRYTEIMFGFDKQANEQHITNALKLFQRR